MYFTRIACIAAGLTFASASYAQAERCVGCTADTQWEVVAGQSQFGSHILYNFARNEIRLYEKKLVPLESAHVDGEEVNLRAAVVRRPVPLMLQTTFDAAHRLWQIRPNLVFSETLILDPFDPQLPSRLRDADAYEVVAASALQNDLTDYISATRQENKFLQFLHSKSVGKYLGIKFDDAMVIYVANVYLPDGGSIEIRNDYSHGGDLYYAKGRSKDSNNNSIIEPDDTFEHDDEH